MIVLGCIPAGLMGLVVNKLDIHTAIGLCSFTAATNFSAGASTPTSTTSNDFAYFEVEILEDQILSDTDCARLCVYVESIYDGSTATTVKLTASTVGLGNVTNESKATMFTNAALTGTPTAPTATAGTSTTQIATTEFVSKKYAVSEVIKLSDSS